MVRARRCGGSGPDVEQGFGDLTQLHVRTTSIRTAKMLSPANAAWRSRSSAGSRSEACAAWKLRKRSIWSFLLALVAAGELDDVGRSVVSRSG
jgi:hypothetical protein